MTLSEAIRLGAMTGSQAFSVMETHDGATCALGAACRAAGFGRGNDRFSAMRNTWPILAQIARCPALVDGCDTVDAALESVIIYLNDEAKWSREHIADFVLKLEQAAVVTPLAVA